SGRFRRRAHDVRHPDGDEEAAGWRDRWRQGRRHRGKCAGDGRGLLPRSQGDGIVRGRENGGSDAAPPCPRPSALLRKEDSPMSNLTTLTIAAAREKLRAKEIRATEIAEAYISAIESANPKLNAYVAVTPDKAREMAR